MKRTTMLKILNPILGVLFVNQIVSGFLYDALPHEAFEIIHGGGGIAFTVAVVLHVILNWNWVKATFFKSRSKAES